MKGDGGGLQGNFVAGNLVVSTISLWSALSVSHFLSCVESLPVANTPQEIRCISAVRREPPVTHDFRSEESDHPS